jgi:hypothetical protein
MGKSLTYLNDIDIPSHPSQNACFQENRQKMLMRMWGTKESYTLVGGNVNQYNHNGNK